MVHYVIPTPPTDDQVCTMLFPTLTYLFLHVNGSQLA